MDLLKEVIAQKRKQIEDIAIESEETVCFAFCFKF